MTEDNWFKKEIEKFKTLEDLLQRCFSNSNE